MKSLAMSVISFAITLSLIMSAHAETPKVYLDERTDGEKFSYLYGSLETAMIMNRKSGNPEKATCIKEWFAGNAEEANQEFINAVHQVKEEDFPVASVILLLIDRHCGDAGAASAQSQPQSE